MLPNLSVLWVVFFVLLLALLLDRLLFRPVLRVMLEREGAVRSARDLARTSAERAAVAANEVDARVRSARAEVYREMDERRRDALGRRAELLAATRKEAEDAISGAARRLAEQARDARARIEREAEDLGSAVAERVLGRKAS